MCEDVVFDTCAFRLLLNEEYVEGIIDSCDNIYVTKHSWKKEQGGVKELRGLHIDYTIVRKLQPTSKLRRVPVLQIKIPQNIKRELERCGADDGDLKVATLAFDRREKSRQNVRLVSKDHCFHDTGRLFENHGITIRNLENEKKALIQVDN